MANLNLTFVSFCSKISLFEQAVCLLETKSGIRESDETSAGCGINIKK